MEMTEWRYQELNLCQLFDILRSERIARLAVVCDDAPYITPMYFQWQLEGDESILHFSCSYANSAPARCAVSTISSLAGFSQFHIISANSATGNHIFISNRLSSTSPHSAALPSVAFAYSAITSRQTSAFTSHQL